MTPRQLQQIIEANTDKDGHEDMTSIGAQVVWASRARREALPSLRAVVATVAIRHSMEDGFIAETPLETALGPDTVDRIVKAVEGSV
jgi:hypothetical protein